jgi:hypothetical protein
MEFLELAACTSWAKHNKASVALAVAKSMWKGVPICTAALSQLTFRHAVAVQVRTGFLPEWARTKHCVYFSLIAPNIFLSEHVKDQLLDCLCAAQRVRWTFVGALRRRAASLARMPGGSAAEVDMSLEPILGRTWRHLVTHHERGQRYVFYIPDLLAHWKAKLSQQSWMEPEPQHADNPYTRERFSHEAFSAVCVAARLQGFRIRGLVELYWAVGCNLTEMMLRGGHHLREAAIVSHAMDGGEELYTDVYDIACAFPERLTGVTLPRSLPAEVARYIVEWFRPALVEYGRMSYGTTDETRAAGRRGLANALMRINAEKQDSPYGFGREVLVRSGDDWTRVWWV